MLLQLLYCVSYKFLEEAGFPIIFVKSDPHEEKQMKWRWAFFDSSQPGIRNHLYGTNLFTGIDDDIIKIGHLMGPRPT